MKLFKAAMNRSVEKELNCNQFSYKYKKFAPRAKSSKSDKDYITLEQLEAIKSIEIEDVRGKRPYQKVELYIDVVTFMYETMSRPADVLEAKADDIIGNTWIYLPFKKSRFRGKSNEDKQKAKIPITDEAARIIKKYEGQSPYGYIFPVNCNLHDYSDKWKTRNNMRNRVEREINSLLKDIAEKLGMKKFKLVMYSFRKTSLTNAANNPKFNLAKVAKMAGTSVPMLPEYYINTDV